LKNYTPSFTAKITTRSILLQITKSQYDIAVQGTNKLSSDSKKEDELELEFIKLQDDTNELKMMTIPQKKTHSPLLLKQIRKLKEKFSLRSAPNLLEDKV